MRTLRFGLLAALMCSVGSVAGAQAPAVEPARQAPAAAPGGHAHAAGEELVIDGKAVGKKVPSRPGDVCLLCNQPVGKDDAVYLVNGQRVAVHPEEMKDATAAARLRGFLAQIRPRGAFLSAEQGAGTLSEAWFYFGLYVLVGLVFGAVCAHRALHAGYNPVSWFAAGLLFNVVGYLALLTRPKREVQAPAGIPAGLRKISATYAPQACACGATNHPSAVECSGCGAKLKPQLTSEVVRAGLRAS